LKSRYDDGRFLNSLNGDLGGMFVKTIEKQNIKPAMFDSAGRAEVEPRSRYRAARYRDSRDSTLFEYSV
jgi:hypothetical protein